MPAGRSVEVRRAGDGLPGTDFLDQRRLTFFEQTPCSRKGRLIGRVLEEATAGGHETRVVSGHLASTASPTGLKTIVHYRQVGSTRYFSAAGFAGRTVGLDAAGRPDYLDDAVNKSRAPARSESPER
jgi:hypothetical protein